MDENFIQYVNQYSNLVFSICYKITKDYFDAEDLTQETFLSVYKHLPSFDGQNERAWICRIATNKSLDYLKKATRRSTPTEDTYFHGMEQKGLTVEEDYFDKEVKRQLLQICEQLKPPYNEVAKDYFYKEMTVNEIASAKGKNPKTIQTQVYRAKAMLKKLWRRE